MRGPLLPFITAQLCGLLLGAALSGWLQLPLFTTPWLMGTAAVIATALLQMRWWWFPINLLFPVVTTLLLGLAIPPLFYLVAFLLLLLVFRNGIHEQVPLYLSNRSTWEALDNLVSEQQSRSFIDLGSGLGGTALYLARHHPDCECHGVESAPLPYLIARLRQGLSGLPNIHFHYGDIWRQQLAAHDFIYAFLSPVPMTRLWDKVEKEGRPGTLFVSNSFPVPGQDEERLITLTDARQTRLHLWQR